MPQRKTKRRRRGQGSVQAHHGGYRARIRRNGKTVYSRVFEHWSDADSERARLCAQDGEPDEGVTLGQVCGWWLEATRESYSLSTYRQNEAMIRLQIAPRIGHVAVAEVSALAVEGFMSHLASCDYSPSYRRKHLMLLRWVLDYAVSHKLAAVNPAKQVRLPRIKHHEQEYLTPDECERFLYAASKDRYDLLLHVALACGCRVSEAVGLQWADFSGDTLSIKRAVREDGSAWEIKEPKTRQKRSVWVPPSVLDSLARHRQRLNGQALSEWVFRYDRDGEFPRRARLNNHVAMVARAAGISKHVTMHTLRHSHATLMVSKGVHLKVAQERLGHSTIQITADLYSHVSAEMQKTALQGVIR